MNLVDSSAWLEYFADGPNAADFATAIEDTPQLLVPSVCVYEVFKRTRQLAGENTALAVISTMLEGTVVDLTARLAMEAGRIASDLSLAMADAIILTTARAYNATVWTQDVDFADIEGVEYRPAQK